MGPDMYVLASSDREP